MSQRTKPRPRTKTKSSGKYKNNVPLFIFGAPSASVDGDVIPGGRPRRKLKTVLRFDQLQFDNKKKPSSCKIGYGFNCPRCSHTCSYDSKACSICQLECYYEAGIGVVTLKGRKGNASAYQNKKHAQQQTKRRKKKSSNKATSSAAKESSVIAAVPTGTLEDPLVGATPAAHARASTGRSDGGTSKARSTQRLLIGPATNARTDRSPMDGEAPPQDQDKLIATGNTKHSHGHPAPSRGKEPAKSSRQPPVKKSVPGSKVGAQDDSEQQNVQGLLESNSLQVERSKENSSQGEPNEAVARDTNANGTDGWEEERKGLLAELQTLRTKGGAQSAKVSQLETSIAEICGFFAWLLSSSSIGNKPGETAHRTVETNFQENNNQSQKSLIEKMLGLKSQVESAHETLVSDFRDTRRDKWNLASQVSRQTATVEALKKEVSDLKKQVSTLSSERDKLEKKVREVPDETENATEYLSTRRSGRKPKSVIPFDPSVSRDSTSLCNVVDGFSCPKCSNTCSYNSRVCGVCGTECYWEAGIGVVMPNERNPMSTKRSQEKATLYNQHVLRPSRAAKRRRIDYKAARSNQSTTKATSASNNKNGRTGEFPRCTNDLDQAARPSAGNDLREEFAGLDKELVETIENEIMMKKDSVTLNDVAGLEDAKMAVNEMLLYPSLRPDLFQGLRAPKTRGLLLFGPPGTGKTLMGKAIAYEIGATFFSISSSSLTSKWQGDGEKLVRTLFEVAQSKAPSVIFFDEVDSLLTERKSDQSESDLRMKTEFFLRMQGISSSCDNVLFIGTTNKPWLLDKAVLRRFAKRLYIPLPNQVGREAIIANLLAKNNHTLTRQQVTKLSEDTAGFSGADVMTLCEDAAMGAIRSLGSSVIDANKNLPITFRHFRRSLSGMAPSVAIEDLAEFENWNDKHGSKIIICGSETESSESDKCSDNEKMPTEQKVSQVYV